MKIKEVIKFKGWKDGSGWKYEETYSNNIIEISESEINDLSNPNKYDWDWFTMDFNPEDEGEDIKIVVEFYEKDAEPDWDKPIAKISKWASDIWRERNAD